MLAVEDSVKGKQSNYLGAPMVSTSDNILYDRLIECCTWIVDQGLPYLMPLPVQSTTLAEALKQKNNFENEFYRPVEVTLKECHQILKEVHQSLQSTSNDGGLELMADNLKSLMKDLKTKTEQRMKHFREKKEFMHSLAKAESWCDRASDFCETKGKFKPVQKHSHSPLSSPQNTGKKLELFLQKHPPLAKEELRHLLKYSETIDDVVLRDRARLLGNRCHELETLLRARGACDVSVSGKSAMKYLPKRYDVISGRQNFDFDLYDDQSGSSFNQNSWAEHREYTVAGQMRSHSSISKDLTTKRWHVPDDVTSMTLLSDIDVGESHRCEGSRLADIQRKLRDQELLHEQLILEEELRKLNEQVKMSRGDSDIGLSSSCQVLNQSNMANISSKLEVRKDKENFVNLKRNNKSEVGERFERGFQTKDKHQPHNNQNGFGGQKTEVDKFGGTKLGQTGLETLRSNLGKSFDAERMYNAIELTGASEKTRKVGKQEISSLSSKVLDGCDNLKRLCENRLVKDPEIFCHNFHFASRGNSIFSPCEIEKRSRDFKNNSRNLGHVSRDFQLHPPDHKQPSCDFVTCSRTQVENSYTLDFLSHDTEKLSLFTKDTSREEVVASARKAVEHWTLVKNEQRKRLTEVISDINTRKEIEELYFEAQINLSKAKQNFAKFNKSDTSLPLNSDVMDCSVTSLADTSDTLQDDKDQSFNGESAKQGLKTFSKIIPPDSAQGRAMLRESDDKWEIEQRSSDESEVEQESSDEFDDVEEDELMLLCSRSSSGMLSQDELKDSLRAEQEKLEKMFREQKEQLREEREKIQEEEMRLCEWANISKEERKSEESGVLKMEHGNLNVDKDEESIMESSSAAALQKIEKNDKTPVDLKESETRNGRLRSKQSLENLWYFVENSEKDLLEKVERTNTTGNFKSPQHELEDSENVLGNPEHVSLDPQHVIENLGHVFADPHYVVENHVQVFENSQQALENPQNEEERVQHVLEDQEHVIEHPEHGVKGFDAVMGNCQHAFEHETVLNETGQVRKDTEKNDKDANEIFVNSFDSEEESRKEIEEELINILQETTFEIDDEKRREEEKEFGANCPSLVLNNNVVPTFESNNDIDFMNQLNDDVMISDLGRTMPANYNGVNVEKGMINVDKGRISDGDVRVDMDTLGMNLSNHAISFEITGKYSDNVGVDMDEVTMNFGNDDGIQDGIGVNVDNGWINVDKNDVGRNVSDEHVGVNVSFVSDNVFENNAIDDKNEVELGLDIDFTVDLGKGNETVRENELIDILCRQSDAVSSQESIDVDNESVSDGNGEIFGTMRLGDDDDVGLSREIETRARDFEERTRDLMNGSRDFENNSRNLENGACEFEANAREENSSDDSESSSPENQSHDGVAEERLWLESENTDNDDDFSRVLEDIQEEESEYEDLMRFTRTHVNNNGNEVQEQAKTMVSSTSQMTEPLRCKETVSTQFSSAVIIDPGSGYLKAGFSIDDQPRVIMPSVVGKPRAQFASTSRYKEYYVGDEIKGLRQMLDLQRPFKNGFVDNWDIMEKLLDEIYEELRCESDQYPVLLSEPVCNSKSNREEMIQVLFETFHVPAAYTCAHAVLSLFATGRTTGVVYDCGYSKAHSVSVYEGYALPHSTLTTDLAGHELTTCLSRMLRDRGVSMETQAELDIIRDIKETLCYVVVDYESERKAYNTGERNDTFYSMPDGQTIAVGSERFRCPELLFTPSMVGMETDGVHEIIHKSALNCGTDVRSSLLQNIVISGGSTMFPGFARRLHVELCKLFGTRAPESVNIDAIQSRNMLTWQGGAMLSKLSNFSSMWITSSEYEEFGPEIVHKKCV